MREYMVAVYDVTDFTEAERDGLAGELDAQADRSELHPSTGIVVGTAEQAGDGVQHVGMFTEDDVEIGVVVKTSTVPTLDLTWVDEHDHEFAAYLVASPSERARVLGRVLDLDDPDAHEERAEALRAAGDDRRKAERESGRG